MRPHRLVVNHHPVDAELIAELAEAVREKRFTHGHKHFTTVAECFVNTLRFFVAVDAERQVRAAHRLDTWTVAGHYDAIAEGESGVHHSVRLETGGKILRSRAVLGHLAKRHFAKDF